MVSEFSSGVAALDTDANPIARDALTRATQIVPAEPAAWADLALAQIRLGDYESASAGLVKAHVLAPESGPIESLLALLEQRRGRFAESVDHLKRAIERNPKDLRSLYTLVRGAGASGGRRPGGPSHPGEHPRRPEQPRGPARQGTPGGEDRRFGGIGRRGPTSQGAVGLMAAQRPPAIRRPGKGHRRRQPTPGHHGE